MSALRNDTIARKNEILRITIDQYIDTVTPVSSARISQQCSFDVSPATIRNILAELEREGYLTHPHTSAGRVPTQQGYRYYVDHFMSEIQLLEDEKMRIKAEYNRQSRELEQLLEMTSKSLSATTHYTSIVSVDGWDHKLFHSGTSFIMGYPDYSDINRDVLKITNILLALEEKERILELINRDLAKKIEILIGHEMQCAEMDGCSLVVSKYRSNNGPSGRIAILGPTRMDYNRAVSALDYFTNLMEEIL